MQVQRALVVGLWALGVCCLSACSSEAKLRRDGPTPFVRCAAGPELADRTLRVGELTLEIEDRVLTIQGPARPLRVAAFSAAGVDGALELNALDALRRTRADLLILLGGLGDRAEQVAATFARLASLSVPTLAVLGGRDGWAVHEKALETLENKSRIIDATVLRAIRIGKNTLVPLAGAEAGRYALNAASCGFDAADLDLIASELGAPEAGERRWLLSWQAPTQLETEPGPQTGAGIALGSVRIAEFARRVVARGALYAWPPDEANGPPVPGDELGVIGVPRLSGPRPEASDGTRAELAALVLELDPLGARVVAGP